MALVAPIENAIKHSGDEEVQILVKLHRASPMDQNQDCKLVTMVNDLGVGIQRNVLKQINNPKASESQD